MPHDLKIDTDIPIPPKRSNVSPLVEFARRMKVGDSVLIDPEDYGESAMAHMTRSTGYKFTQRVENFEDKRHIRIWRVE